MFEMKRYLETPGALSVGIAERLYNETHPQHCEQDPDWQELWTDLLQAALAYVRDRNIWNEMSADQRQVSGSSRSARHNAYMAYLSALGRYCQQVYGSTWLEELGSRECDRKRLGDFAGYIVWFGALKGR
jgi:hypothetical protein